MVSDDLLPFMLKIETTTQGANSMPFLDFRWDHLRSTSGIINFVVQFEDHFRSGNHFRSGIICGAVQLYHVRRRFNREPSRKPVKKN